ADASPLLQAAQCQLAADHADRTRQRARLGVDLVAAHADVVTTAGRDVAHASDRRLLALPQLVPNQVAGQGRAAGTVHAQHDRLDRLVLFRLADGVHHRRRTDHAAAEQSLAALAMLDRADRIDYGNLRLLRAALLWRAHQLHQWRERVVVLLRLCLAVVLGNFDLRKVLQLLDLFLHDFAVGNAVDQTQILRLSSAVRGVVDDLLHDLGRPFLG